MTDIDPDGIQGSTPALQNFLDTYYPHTSPTQRRDWHWQVQHSIISVETLQKFLVLSPEEQAFFTQSSMGNFRITPYYLKLLVDHPTSSLRRSMVPVLSETKVSPGEAEDPLHEEMTNPVPCIVHRYPDRVLFLVTNFCSARCRYCTRSRIIANDTSHNISRASRQQGIDYISAHPEVRDVLISGGDPLTLADTELEWLLERVRSIPHVELIRIGTKVPMVLPQRITPELCTILKKYHPIFISIHATHPDELTMEAKKACTDLADAGIPLGSQTVLLRDINDDIITMKTLMQGLLTCRVRPYYLYQCDPILGSAHFRTSVDKGLEIIQGLRGWTTGYAVPHFVIDAPGGGGKIPLLPEYYQGIDADGNVLLKNYEGKPYMYPSVS